MNERYERGLATLKKVDPAMAQGLHAWLGEPLKDLGKLTIEFGYGDVMSRPGMDLPTRELLTIAMLAAMGTAPRQLEMHVQSALHLGMPAATLHELVLQVAAYAGFPAAYNLATALKARLDQDAPPSGASQGSAQ